MGYTPFEPGEQLSPEKLNAKINQLNNMITKAFSYNNLLKRRLSIQGVAFEAVAALLDSNTDGSVDWDIPEAYNIYNRADNSGREVFIGGQALFNTTGAFIKDAATTLETDGINAVLSKPAGSSSVSRIPLTTNQFDEREPSIGTSFSSDEFSTEDLWLMLSPDGIWAEKIATETGTITIDLPDSLTPFLNKIKISPIPGTSYRLYYDSGSGINTEITSEDDYVHGTQYFYIDKDSFNGNLVLELKGSLIETGVYGFGINHIQAYYVPFNNNGILKGILTLPAEDGTLTDLSSGEDIGPSVRLRIATGGYPESGTETIVYDSDIDAYPLIAGSLPFVTDTLYIQFDVIKTMGTTPVIPHLLLKYQP